MPQLFRSLLLVTSLLFALPAGATEPVNVKFCEVVEQEADDVISVPGVPGTGKNLFTEQEIKDLAAAVMLGIQNMTGSAG